MRRNPQDTIASLQDDLKQKDGYIEELEDKLDRLSGRLTRVHSIADIEDIVGEDDEDEDEDDDGDEDDDDGDDEDS